MDSSEILSNDEVDALRDEGKQSTAPASEAHNVQLVDFAINEQNGLGSYPGFHPINELFLNEVDNRLSYLLQCKAVVDLESTNITSFGQYRVSLEGQTALNQINIKSSNHIVLINLDSKILYCATSTLFGGTLIEDEAIPEKVGKVELHIATRMAKIIMESLDAVWKDIGKLDFEIEKTTTNAGLLSTIPNAESFLVAKYSISLGAMTGTFDLCLQRSLLEPLKPITPGKSKNPNIRREENIWKKNLENNVLESNITLIASFPDVHIDLKALSNLKEGDVIPIANPEQIEIHSKSVSLFSAQAGSANGTRVIKITGKLKD